MCISSRRGFLVRSARSAAGTLFVIPAFSRAADALPPIPDDILYRTLFMHVVMQEKFADQIDAQHRRAPGGAVLNGDRVRSKTRNDANLTVPEDNLLKSVAKDWMAQDQIYQSQTTQIGGTQPGATRTAQLNAAFAQQRAMLMQHVDQLKNGFGPQRFAALEAWVRSTLG